MKTLLRYFLINLVSLLAVTEILKGGLIFTGGIQNLLIGSLAFTVINLILVPLLKILFLPLNILTLGLFSWLTNVLALYVLTTSVPAFRLLPYHFSGFVYSGFVVPSADLNTFWVAVLASMLIGLFTHLLHWIMH